MFAVLGATGKAGGASVRALRKRGLPVRAIVRDHRKAGDFEALGCEVAIADFRDAASLAKAIAGVQAVQAICPAVPQAEDTAADMRAMIDAIREALIAAKTEKVVAISDYGAERSSGTGITLAFHYLEARLRETPAKLTLLRSSEHMQNWARSFKAAAATGVLPSLHHPLTKVFPMVSAQDLGLVAADLLASADAEQPPRIVSVAGPRLSPSSLYRAGCRQGRQRRIRPADHRARTAAVGVGDESHAGRPEPGLCQPRRRAL
jgi:NAD(P)H dehydrogenase (quinone)